MAHHQRINVVYKMKATGLVPVLYHTDATMCLKLIESCYNAGVRAFEFTNRGDFAHEVFADICKGVRQKMPELALGAGSVPDAATAALYMQLGADFIVTPATDEDMARVCNRRKVLWIPGCGTTTEIARAESLGAEIVKIFPAEQVGGPSFVKAVKAPCPWTDMMPTGGVQATEENLKAWFEAGVACVGMGSKLLSDDIIARKDFDALEKQVSKTLEIIKKYNKHGV